MSGIEWEDGYPTDESLAREAAKWKIPVPLEQIQDAPRWLRTELGKASEHCCCSYREEEGKDILDRPTLKAYFSTGGWSGAESLMALIEDSFWLKYHMAQWNRGGHYIFEFKAEAPDCPSHADQKEAANRLARK